MSENLAKCISRAFVQEIAVQHATCSDIAICGLDQLNFDIGKLICKRSGVIGMLRSTYRRSTISRRNPDSNTFDCRRVYIIDWCRFTYNIARDHWITIHLSIANPITQYRHSGF